MKGAKETEWGLAAVGQSGAVQVDVDESCSEPARWELSIDQPQIYLRFEIPGPHVVGELLAFLQRHWGQSSADELRLGAIGDAKVSIIKDDEFADRFFLCVASENGALQYSLRSEEVESYIAALRSAKEDLSDGT
ncbi:MAG: hypothetical protein GY719_07895 [bacterium]|nr:hypothetical protein [bacterium]